MVAKQLSTLVITRKCKWGIITKKIFYSFVFQGINSKEWRSENMKVPWNKTQHTNYIVVFHWQWNHMPTWHPTPSVDFISDKIKCRWLLSSGSKEIFVLSQHDSEPRWSSEQALLYFMLPDRAPASSHDTFQRHSSSHWEEEKVKKASFWQKWVNGMKQKQIVRQVEANTICSKRRHLR